MKIDVYSYTDAGGRDHNEDTISCKTKDGSGLFLVADGLGGHAKGELASRCAAQVMFADWEPYMEQEGEDSAPKNRLQWLCDKLIESNNAILKMQKEQGCIMKSTAVVLAIDNNTACWAHVGDSRLYYIRQGRINHITRDHSVAFKKYLNGEISRWQINTDYDQSVLLRTLGNADRHEPETGRSITKLTSGDAFMLCSDGVWEYLHDTEVLVDYLKSQNAEEWGTYLLMRVMDRIDSDNDNLSIITVIVEET